MSSDELPHTPSPTPSTSENELDEIISVKNEKEEYESGDIVIKTTETPLPYNDNLTYELAIKRATEESKKIAREVY